MKGLDWSFSELPIEDMPRWGYTFFFRYICYRNSNTVGKIITPEELDRLTKAGMHGWINWEWYSSRAKEGRIAGLLDGHEAHNQLAALRLPHGSVVPVSDDSGTTGPSNIAAVLAYLDAFQANCPGYVVVPYGNDYLVTAWYQYRKRKGWQTLAWSGGRISPYAFAYQNGRQAYNNRADENIIYEAYLRESLPIVVPDPLPPLPIHIPPEEIQTVHGYLHHYPREAKKGVYLVATDLSYKIHITEPQSLAFLVGTKLYVNSGLTDAMVDTIPTRKA